MTLEWNKFCRSRRQFFPCLPISASLEVIGHTRRGIAVYAELLGKLKERFEQNMERHAKIAWEDVLARLQADSGKLRSLQAMEDSGGEPDVIGTDDEGRFIFLRLCGGKSGWTPQSVLGPAGPGSKRKEGCVSREGNAVDMAAEMGIELLDEEQYRVLQKLGPFDTKTSSWLQTPVDIRERGGAVFGDYRYGRVLFTTIVPVPSTVPEDFAAYSGSSCQSRPGLWYCRLGLPRQSRRGFPFTDAPIRSRLAVTSLQSIFTGNSQGEEVKTSAVFGRTGGAYAIPRIDSDVVVVFCGGQKQGAVPESASLPQTPAQLCRISPLPVGKRHAGGCGREWCLPEGLSKVDQPNLWSAANRRSPRAGYPCSRSGCPTSKQQGPYLHRPQSRCHRDLRSRSLHSGKVIGGAKPDAILDKMNREGRQVRALRQPQCEVVEPCSLSWLWDDIGGLK